MDEQWKNLLLTIDESYVKGEQIYQTLMKMTGEKSEVLVCPEHIGDTVLIASMATEYKKQNALERLIIVSYTVPPEVLQLFPGVDFALKIEEQAMQMLGFYMIVTSYYYANGIRYAFYRRWAELHKNGIILNSVLEKRSLIDTIRGMLDLGPATCMHQMENVPDVSEEERMKYRKAVMLMPGTYTEKAMPASFWEKLAAAIREKGFDVYNNYNGRDCEIQIEGVTAISTSLLEISSLASCFSMFVGIRSGICDLLTFAGANKLLMIYHGDQDMYKLETMTGDRYRYWLGNVEENSAIRTVSEGELVDAICEGLTE